MSKSNYWWLAIIGAGIGGGGILMSIYSKYSWITVSHVLNACQSFMGNFYEKYHLLGFVLMLLIVISLILGLGKVFFSYIKTQQKIRKFYGMRIVVPKKLEKLMSKHGISTENILVINSNVDYAATIGIYRPKILLSSKLISRLSKFELEAVLLHEYHHFKSGDGRRLFVSEFIKASLYFLPVLQLFVEYLRRAFEQEADEYVVSKQGKSIYLRRALYKFALNDNSLAFYPQFSFLGANLRVNSINRSVKHGLFSFLSWQMMTSFLVLVIWVVFLSIPVTDSVMANSSDLNCHGNQCSVDCNGEVFSQELEEVNYTPMFYSSL